MAAHPARFERRGDPIRRRSTPELFSEAFLPRLLSGHHHHSPSRHP